MLRKDLLRVSRRGGGYQPEFVGEDRESLAARVIGCYQGHVGEQRQALDAALSELERESDDFKLVRGFAKLIDDDATWRVQSPLVPRKTRGVVFAESEAVDVVTGEERERALTRAAERLGATPGAVEQSLYADREQREVLTELDRQWTPTALIEQYNLSLAQTALFDAREVRIRSDDPKRIISAIKRLRLVYEIRRRPDDQRRTVADTDREIVVTGPDALFGRTRRYGTRFARLLRTVAGTARWHLSATIDDRGTDRDLELSHGDLTVPDVEPVTEVTYDSDVEREFATRFSSLDFDWELVREPDAIEAGEHVVIPDFAFDWRHSDFRVYFEIMGFWTPEYVETKLDRLDAVDIEMLVAVDESLGLAEQSSATNRTESGDVGEEIELRNHRAIPYSGRVSVKDVRNALRRYEDELVATAAEALPEEIRPDQRVTTISELAAEFGVSEAVIEDKEFPEHDRIGRTLVEPAALDDLAEQIDEGMSFEEVEGVLAEAGIEDASSALGALGY
ncbi:MAG: putative nuclease of restriction endonuclease-like RecB superfamily, partial [Natronomonas sp.]